MNKQSFIERLNLFLDEELPSEEVEELMAEIRENPEYHRIYVQYCQLFNACSVLGDKFAEPKSTGQWRQRIYAYGGMAAAIALLLLAARNLSPILEGLDGDPAQSPALASNVNSADSEPLLVVDVDGLEGQMMQLGEFAPASFNIEGAFDRGGRTLNFGTDAAVEFASYTVVQDRANSNGDEKAFSFGEAIQTSTFEHEALTASEVGDQAVFSVRSVGSAFDIEGNDVRYDLNTAAAARTAKP